MTELKLYAVRVTGTELYFLERPRGMRSGYTYLEPGEIDPYALPRLFPTQTGAKIAINAWRKGYWKKQRDRDQSWEGEWEQDEWFEIEPVNHRTDMKLEIVGVDIKIALPQPSVDIQIPSVWVS